MEIATKVQRGRRALLTGGFAGLGALIASLVLAPRRALALTTDDGTTMKVGGDYATAETTTLYNPNSNHPDPALAVANVSGTAIDATCIDGTAVYGTSAETAVYGKATGDGIGVLGNSEAGRAVVGVTSASTGPTIGVMGESISSRGTGVRGWAAGNSTGVLGFSGGSFPSGRVPKKTGVFGRADQSAASVGVQGSSAAGRGGQFDGGVAQIRLTPSTASGPPASGKAGDFFVDSLARLWFCRGGANWQELT
jgi:hypothetical protein